MNTDIVGKSGMKDAFNNASAVADQPKQSSNNLDPKQNSQGLKNYKSQINFKFNLMNFNPFETIFSLYCQFWLFLRQIQAGVQGQHQVQQERSRSLPRWHRQPSLNPQQHNCFCFKFNVWL